MLVIPGIKGAHSQSEIIEELVEKQVLKLLKEDDALEPENGFVGVQNIVA